MRIAKGALSAIFLLIISMFLTLNVEAAITKNTPIVSVSDGNFYVGNDEFRFIGTNNYYLNYKDETMITAVLDDAEAAGFNVIRMWGFFDGDSSSITENKSWMQPEQGVFEKPDWADQEFSSGWDRLDFTVSEAAKRGIRLIIVFANYWDDFGGITEYVGWYNEKYGYSPSDSEYADKHDFFTNEEIKEYYKTYVEYLINRTNQYNGRKYVDDPTIFSWELMNEPRNPYLDGGNITDVTLWADEMSTYIKDVLDPNHLIALGDEGSFDNREDWDYEQQAQHIYDGSEGVDFEAVLALDNIDFGTYHLYPESWGINHSHMEWGSKFILDHINVGKTLNKPVVLEEFGISANLGRNRELIYEQWMKTIYDNDGAGAMFWMYASTDTSESATITGHYPDYDGFRLAEIDGMYPELDVLKRYASIFSGNILESVEKIYVTSPYTTNGFIEIESDLYEDQMYPIKIVVQTQSKIEHVDMFIDGDYYDSLVYDASDQSYNLMFNMRNIYRGSNVNLDFIAYTKQGEISSDTIEMRRLLKFVYDLDQQYTFDATYESNDVQFEYYGAYNAEFYAMNWTALNGGMVQFNADYNKDHFWSEIKLEISNLDISMILEHYILSYDIYFEKDKLIEGVLKPTDEAYETAPGFRHYAAIDPGWAKIGLNENNVKYFEVEEVEIEGITYLKQNIEIRYNANENQTTLVLGIVTNHLLYDGDFYIDNLSFYDRSVSSETFEESDYVDWRLEQEQAALKRKQTIIIVSVVGSVSIAGGLGVGFVIYMKKKRKLES